MPCFSCASPASTHGTTDGISGGSVRMIFRLEKEEKIMVQINSFIGEDCFIGSNAPNNAVKQATKKADNWIEELQDEWNKVVVTALSTQYVTAGDYAMYFITMTVDVDDFREGE
jgi:hypothetical protein